METPLLGKCNAWLLYVNLGHFIEHILICTLVERVNVLFAFCIYRFISDETASGDNGGDQGALFENGARTHERGGRGEEAEDESASRNRPSQENHCNCLAASRNTDIKQKSISLNNLESFSRNRADDA